MHILRSAVAVAVASLSLSASAQVLPAGATDQIPGALVALPAPAGDFERRSVAFSWALDPAAPLSPPAPLVAESREYWLPVDGAELARGVEVELTAPGALIRLSPGRGARGLRAADLQLTAQGRRVGLQRTASDAELRAAGMDVVLGTAMVRVADTAARGPHRLRVANARGRYVMHVFEPNSPVVLRAQASHNRVVAGAPVALEVSLSDAGRPLPATAEALLVAPDGRSTLVPVTPRGPGRLSATVRAPQAVTGAPGLWELQVFVAGAGVQRDARTAFAIAAPTARLAGRYVADRRGLRMGLPLAVGSPGRYEVRGTLHATARDGRLRPVSQAHAAAWFEPGRGLLTLAFDPAHLPAGYGAPFEVRGIELHDQTRLVPIETRTGAARL